MTVLELSEFIKELEEKFGVSAAAPAAAMMVAAPAAGMTASEIRTAQHNGLTLAFLSDGEKAELSARAAQR